MHEHYMKKAIRQAKLAAQKDEVPIGCVIVDEDGQVIARAYNWRQHNQLATAHAEIRAIEKACRKVGSWRLENCTLYVTIEPCPMCAGAIVLSRIKQVVYGAKDPKGGSVDSCMKMFETPGFNHYPSWIGGVLEEECGQLMKDFFQQKRLDKSKTKVL
ncbi:MAG: tRNA adenosine(34) deaminase TadA [Erysipelotrichaceae bacterium]